MIWFGLLCYILVAELSANHLTESAIFRQIKSKRLANLFFRREGDLDITDNVAPQVLENQWKNYFSSRSNGTQFQEKVAIIVSAKNRKTNLRIFLKNMIPFLVRNNVYFKLIVVEPVDLYNTKKPFNSGLLRNVGFVETSGMEDDFNCYIFHDVDFIPINPGIGYTCKESPQLLFKTIQNYANRRKREQMRHSLKETVFISPNKRGCCVLAISKSHFRLVNGFPNAYWGWGQEDFDMHKRIRNKKVKMNTTSIFIGNYYHLDHSLDWEPTKRNERLIKKAYKRFNSDGLNNVHDFYEVVHINEFYHYTHIYVALLPSRHRSRDIQI